MTICGLGLLEHSLSFVLFSKGPPFVDPKKSPLFGNGYHYPPHLATLPMPFMPLGHPMMSMAMANHIGMRADGSVIRDRAVVEHDLASPGYVFIKFQLSISLINKSKSFNCMSPACQRRRSFLALTDVPYSVIHASLMSWTLWRQSFLTK